MTYSVMAEQCRKCKFNKKCKNKKMEFVEELESEEICAEIIQSAGAFASQEVCVKHDYREIKVAANATITIDVEEMKRDFAKDIEKELYKNSGLMYCT